jgi:molecular chaperone DnaK
MSEFEAQLDTAEKEKVKKLLGELREISAKGAAGEADVTAEQIKEAMDAAQQASLGLFQKVYEKRAAEGKSSEAAPEADAEAGKEKKE